MANKETSGYNQSKLPVTDPLRTLAVSAASANNTTTLSYTTTSAHNLVAGSPVIIYGTGSASFNFNPSLANDSTLGFGTPAVVASVTGTNTFTVKAPSVVATASVSQGTVINDTLVSNGPWENAWLPTSSAAAAASNYQVGLEWGDTFPIQPNDARAAQVAITGVSANGAQVTYTVASGHGLVAGQVVSVTGIIPNSYNIEGTIAATGSTSIIFNSTVTDTVASYANGAITNQSPLGGAQARVVSAVGVVAYAGSTSTTTATAAAAATSLAITSTSGLAVGMGVSATASTGIAAGTVITAIGSGTVTINPAVNANTVASAAVITFSASTGNQYVTAFPHNLTSGQSVAITGASNANYNVNGVVTVVDSKTLSVPGTSFKILKVSGTAGTGVVGDGTNVTYYTDSANGLAGGDKVTISGMAPTGYNAVNATVLTTPAPTASSFSVANTTTTAVTAAGAVIKNSGAFSGSANVSLGDNGWASTYLYPSGQLNPALDNHEIVTTSRVGYPDYYPTYVVPNVVGLPISNAIQKIRSAALKPGFLQFSTDITATTVATTSTTLTVTSGTAHNLSVGDTVNLSGSSNTTLNLADVVVSAVPSTVSFTVNAAGCTGTVGATALVFRPKNGVVSAQSPAAGTVLTTGTDNLAVGITRNYGL